MTDQDRTAAPRPSTADVQRMLARQVGLPSRLAYTALLLAGVGGAAVSGALLLTEPALPARTRIAFGLMVGIGMSWAGFATWVLARRRVLLAGHRVVAATMAVAFSALFTLGAVAVGRWGHAGSAWIAAAGVGTIMTGVAAVLLVRARSRRDALLQRRRELERAAGTRGAHA